MYYNAVDKAGKKVNNKPFRSLRLAKVATKGKDVKLVKQRKVTTC